MTKKRAIRDFPIHPILFALFPVLSLLALNLDQVQAGAAVRSGLLSMAAAALLFLILRLVIKNTARAALLATAWLALFFTYGHVYQLVEGRSLAGFVYGKHRFMIAAWLVLGIAVTAWILKRVRAARELTQVLNIASAFLVIFPLVQVGLFEARAARLSTVPDTLAGSANSAASGQPAPAENSAGPDVYYILLDGYSRADVMQSLYHLDITPFMDELKAMGFVFPNCTQSNYAMTGFSMFASLNMDYLDAYRDVIPLGSDMDEVDYTTLRGYLVNNKVRQYLKARGYQMVTFETGFWWLSIDDSDVYIVANNNPLKKYSRTYDISNFEDLFIRTTALRVLTEATASYLGPLNHKVKTPIEQHYDWVKFELDELDKVPEIPGRKFVYFHVLAPHTPYVFEPDGSFRATAKSREPEDPGYPGEVTYLNKRVVAIVRSLIAKSATPPVIVIQGDHGWNPLHRLQILNAYYLPGGGSDLVYPTITPVNTFRLILNRYFGGSFPLLPDRSYFSLGDELPAYGISSRPYQMTPVPGSCMSK